MIKEIQLRINLIEEKKEDILTYKASKKLDYYLLIKFLFFHYLYEAQN